MKQTLSMLFIACTLISTCLFIATVAVKDKKPSLCADLGTGAAIFAAGALVFALGGFVLRW